MIGKQRAFIADFYCNNPVASRHALTLVLVGGFLEGTGIMLFLPFFQAIAELSVGSISVPMVGQIPMPVWLTPQKLLLSTCVLFFCVAVLRAGVIGLRDARVFQLVLRFVDRLRFDLFRSVAESPWHKQAQIDQSEIESALISGTERVRAAAVLTSLSAIDVVMLIVQSAILFYISPALAVISLGMILLALTAIYPQIRKSFDLGKSLTEVEQNLHLIGTELLTDLKTAKGQNLEAKYTSVFSDTLNTREITMTGFRFRQILAQGLLQLVLAAVALVILLTGVFILEVQAATALLTVVVLARLTVPVFRLYSNFQVLAHTLPVYDTLIGLIRRFGTVPQPKLRADVLQPAQWSGPLLEIEGAGFTRQAGVAVLSGITLQVAAGDRIALFGNSGSGKTTLIDLVLGLHEATEGQIRYFGKPATEATAFAFREICSYVPQDAFVMGGTIADNLRWMSPASPDAILRAALDGVGAQKLRLDQDVGTRGALLSGGERQRVRLAQALLRRPRLLVLDEALNAIEQRDVAPLLQGLQRFDPDMALIYVTHRLSDLAYVDRVFEMSDGRLLERGADAAQKSGLTHQAKGKQTEFATGRGQGAEL